MLTNACCRGCVGVGTHLQKFKDANCNERVWASNPASPGIGSKFGRLACHGQVTAEEDAEVASVGETVSIVERIKPLLCCTIICMSILAIVRVRVHSFRHACVSRDRPGHSTASGLPRESPSHRLHKQDMQSGPHAAFLPPGLVVQQPLPVCDNRLRGECNGTPDKNRGSRHGRLPCRLPATVTPKVIMGSASPVWAIPSPTAFDVAANHLWRLPACSRWQSGSTSSRLLPNRRTHLPRR